MAMSAQEFLDPITAYLRTNFVTARAVARHMLEARAGVILSVSPPMARMPVALSGPFGMAGAATEALCRRWWARPGTVRRPAAAASRHRPHSGPGAGVRSRSAGRYGGA
ncbi:hypothetical protein GCM10023178_06810 [Actinomadura luteofluorescens]